VILLFRVIDSVVYRSLHGNAGTVNERSSEHRRFRITGSTINKKTGVSVYAGPRGIRSVDIFLAAPSALRRELVSVTSLQLTPWLLFSADSGRRRPVGLQYSLEDGALETELHAAMVAMCCLFSGTYYR
jgi:hypothetical protein